MLKGIAKDMGIPVSRLMRDVGMLKLAGIEIPNMPEEKKTIDRNADNVSEKFGTFQSDKAANIWAGISRDAMRKDPAAIAARKICRAIPRDKDALVSTKRGYEIVTISRVERAANIATLEKQLAKAIKLEAEAMEERAAKVAIAAKRTNLDRTPKADKARANRASANSDRHSARVRHCRKKLNQAKQQKSARGLTAIRVADIRVNLRPQSMANRTALAALELPARKDVHPFPEYPRIRAVTATSAISAIGDPVGELLIAEAEAEAEAMKAAREADKQNRKNEIAARINAEIAAEKAIEKENKRIEYNSRRALAAKVRRANSKKYGKQKRMK